MDELISGLLEDRARSWEQAKALLDREVEEKRTLDAAETEEFTRINTHIQELDARIDELHALNVANKKADEKRAEIETVVRPDVVAAAEGEEARALRELFSGKRRFVDIDLTGVQRHMDPKHFGYEVRDLAKVVANNANTVPTSFRASLYEHMIENAAMRQTNVTVFQTASGENLDWPKVAAFGTAAIVGEGSALAEADPGFAKTTFGAWKYGQLLQISNELLSDTGVDMLGFLARDFGRALGNASGAAYITGGGVVAPEGVQTAAGTGKDSAADGTIDADDLIDLQYSVIEPYASNGFWLMRRATEGAVRKVKDGNGQYLWQPGLQAGSPNLILGRPVVTDPNVAAVASAAKSVYFGDFSRGFHIRDVGAVRIERSDDYSFNTDQVTFRAILRTDQRMVDANAVKALITD